MQVRLRCEDWDRVMAADLSNVPCLKLAPGFEIYIMPGGLQVGYRPKLRACMLHTRQQQIIKVTCSYGGQGTPTALSTT